MKHHETALKSHPFLPLDFWGAEEQASPNSPFFDSINDRQLTAPVLCNADGSPTEFSEFMIKAMLSVLFGSEDSISLNRIIEYCIHESKLQLGFHVLATAPEQMKSQLEVMDCYNYADSLSLEVKEKYVTKVNGSVGFFILCFPSGNISRSELKDLYIDSLRHGLCSDTNLDFFTFFAILSMNGNCPHSIPELLKAYCDMSSDITTKNTGSEI